MSTLQVLVIVFAIWLVGGILLVWRSHRGRKLLTESSASQAGKSAKRRGKETKQKHTDEPVEERLKPCIEALRTGVTRLGSDDSALTAASRMLTVLHESLDQPLLVTVLGEFSAGKSTFINALIGEKLLAMRIKPTTATISRLQYGDNKRLLVRFRNGKEEQFPLEQLETVTVERVVEEGDILDQVQLVQVELPHELLRTMDLADTPGFNSKVARHSEITAEFIAHSDTIFWIFKADRIMKGTEVRLLEQHCKQFKPVAIINYCDCIELEEGQSYQDVLSPALEKLNGLIDRVFYTSARSALETSNGGLTASGIPAVREYLVTEIIPNAKRRKHQVLFMKLSQVCLDLLDFQTRTVAILTERKRTIDDFKRRVAEFRNREAKASKAIQDWNGDLKAQKGNYWILGHIHRYFTCMEMPARMRSRASTLVSEFEKVHADYDRITNWSAEIEAQRGQLQRMFEYWQAKYKEWDEAWLGFKSLFGKMTEQGRQVDALANQYVNSENQFNAQVEQFNRFLNRTNEQSESVETASHEFLNSQVVPALNEQYGLIEEEGKRIETEHEHISKCEVEYASLSTLLDKFSSMVVPRIKELATHVTDGRLKPGTDERGLADLIEGFRSVAVEHVQLDWKQLYTRSKLQTVIEKAGTPIEKRRAPELGKDRRSVRYTKN